MTEQDYVNVSELKSVLHAQDILKDIVPENSNIITRGEYEFVMNLLHEWEIDLLKETKLK